MEKKIDKVKKKKQPTCDEIIKALEDYREQLYVSKTIKSTEFTHMQTALHWAKQIVRDKFGVAREQGAVAWVK